MRALLAASHAIRLWFLTDLFYLFPSVIDYLRKSRYVSVRPQTLSLFFFHKYPSSGVLISRGGGIVYGRTASYELLPLFFIFVFFFGRPWLFMKFS